MATKSVKIGLYLHFYARLRPFLQTKNARAAHAGSQHSLFFLPRRAYVERIGPASDAPIIF